MKVIRWLFFFINHLLLQLNSTNSHRFMVHITGWKVGIDRGGSAVLISTYRHVNYERLVLLIT